MQYYIYNVLGINLLTNTLILSCNLQNIYYNIETSRCKKISIHTRCIHFITPGNKYKKFLVSHIFHQNVSKDAILEIL